MDEQKNDIKSKQPMCNKNQIKWKIWLHWMKTLMEHIFFLLKLKSGSGNIKTLMKHIFVL